MARPRAVIASALLVTGLVWTAPALASRPPVGAAVTVDSTAGEDVTDSTVVWRLENEPSACINSNPRPNCGYKPQDAGERGGALQITLFFVLIGALAVILAVVFRNVARRDRALAESIERSGSSEDRTAAGESPSAR